MNVQPAFLAKRRKPRFKLPPGSCDAHCHVFGPGDKFPYAPNRRYTPEDAPKETLAVLHAHLGIDRAETRESHAVAAIAGRQHTIKHVDTAFDRFHQVVRRAHAH